VRSNSGCARSSSMTRGRYCTASNAARNVAAVIPAARALARKPLTQRAKPCCSATSSAAERAGALAAAAGDCWGAANDAVVPHASAANASVVQASQGRRGGAEVGSCIGGDSRPLPSMTAAAQGRCGQVWHRSGRGSCSPTASQSHCDRRPGAGRRSCHSWRQVQREAPRRSGDGFRRARRGARRRIPVLAAAACIDGDTIAAGAGVLRSIYC